jgi:hypothetical protein
MKRKRKHGGELTESFGDDPKKTKLEFKPDSRRSTYADEQSTRNKKEKKMRVGGLTGNQTKMDMNKNNKIDSEDFKMLRNKKSMAKGGAVKQMAKGGSLKMRGGGMAKGYAIGGAIEKIKNKKMAKGGAVKPMAKGGPIKMRTGKLVKAKAKGSNTGGVKRVAKNKRDGIAKRGKTRA